MRRLVTALFLFGALSLGAREFAAHPDLRIAPLLVDEGDRKDPWPGLGLTGRGDDALLMTYGGDLLEVLGGGVIELPGEGPVADVSKVGGRILLTRGKRLLAIEDEMLVELTKLPWADMRLRLRSDGKGVLLYGGTGGPGRRIIELQSSGLYKYLVEADAPVTAVAESKGDVLFAVGRDVYLLPDKGRPGLLYRSHEPVISLEIDPESGMPFVGTPTSVTGLRPVGPVVLTAGVGGILLHDGENLYVHDLAARTLLVVADPVRALLPGRVSDPAAPPGDH